ncbi:MAG: hypothetical protein ABJG68_00160 [Crocinitomicaceae bacterium]
MDTLSIINNYNQTDIDTITVNLNTYEIIDRLDSLNTHLEKGFTQIETAIVNSNAKKDYLPFISNDALFSTLITVIIFSLGIIINILLKRRDKRILRSEMRSYIKHHIDEMLAGYTPVLKEAYLKLSNDTTIDSGIPMTPPKLLSNDFQRILSVDIVELHKAVVNKKSLSGLISQIEFLNRLLDEVQFYHERVLEDTKKHRSQLENSIYQYIELLAEFIEHEDKINPEGERSEAYNLFNGGILKYYTEIAGQRELQKLYDEIIRTNQEFIVTSQLYKTNPLGQKIAELGKKLSHEFSNLQGITTEFKEQYNSFSELVNKAESSINKKVAEIKW